MKKILILLLLTYMWPATAQTTCVPEPDVSSVFGGRSKAVPSHRSVKRSISVRLASRPMSLYPAEVAYVKGDVFLVERNGAGVEHVLTVGSSLQLGDVVQTGRQSFVTIVLGTGVSSSLPSNSKIRLQQSSNTVARYELLQGSIENRVVKEPNARRSTFEITVPNGILGVRGTHFLVAADVAAQTSAVSVFEGVVVMRPLNSCSTPLVVTAGQSTLIKPTFTQSDVQSSLVAPDLFRVAAQRSNDLSFEFAPVVGASGYVAQVSRDAGFTELIAEAKGEARIVVPATDVQDGFYYVRAGAVDARGVNSYSRAVLFLKNRQ